MFKTNDPEIQFSSESPGNIISCGEDNMKIFVLQLAECGADGLGAHTNTHKWLPASLSAENLSLFNLKFTLIIVSGIRGLFKGRGI